MVRLPSTPAWTAVPDQTGRRYVVTGASSGLGLETARILTSRGADVVLAVRDRARGEQAAARMPGPGSARVALLDVADLSSVRRFAERADELGDIDVLVNNAGVMGVPFTRSPDGHELHLATNHLGHFALTNLLLRRIADRVVVVSSRAHRSGVVDTDDLDWSRRGYRPYPAYAASKLATLLVLAELQRRLTAARSPVRATGAHPGSTATAITGSTGRALLTTVGGLGHRLVGMPAWRGALTTVYAATMDLPGNSYIGPHGRFEMLGWPTGAGRSRDATDPALARRLWEVSEELTGVSFPG